MEYIEETLSKCHKSDREGALGSIVALIFFYAIIPFLVVFNIPINPISIALSALIIPTTGCLLGLKLGNILFKVKKLSLIRQDYINV